MQELLHLITVYGLLLVFAAVFLDEIGLPVPSLPALVIAGAASATSNYSIVSVIGVALSGALLADLIWYQAARRLGRRLLALLCRISLSPDSCVRQTEDLFNRVGPWSLLFARYVPGLSNIAVAMGAITRLSIPKFFLLNLVGGLFYYGAAALTGALFHKAVADVLRTMTALGMISIVMTAGLFILYVALRWWERITFIRQLRMDRISVEQLIAMIEAGNPPVILDVRSADARVRDGIIPGALAAHPADAQSLLTEIAPHSEIVVYCSCPNEASAATAARHLKRAGFKKIRPLLGGIDAWVGAGRSLGKP